MPINEKVLEYMMGFIGEIPRIKRNANKVIMLKIGKNIKEKKRLCFYNEYLYAFSDSDTQIMVEPEIMKKYFTTKGYIEANNTMVDIFPKRKTEKVPLDKFKEIVNNKMKI